MGMSELEKSYICTLAKSCLTAWRRKSLKFARLPTRYLYFSDNLLKVYFSNDYIKPLTI